MKWLKPKIKNQDITTSDSLANQINNPNIESTLPDLNTAPDKNNSVNKIIILGGSLLGIGLIIAGLIYYTSGNSEETTEATPELEMVKQAEQHNFQADKNAILEMAQAASETVASAPNEQSETEILPEETTEATTATVEIDTSTPVEKNVTPHDRKLMGNVLIETGNVSNTAYPNTPNPSDNSGNNFASRLNPTQTASVRAYHRGKRTFLMSKGTNITCTLETKIITTLPGFARCLVSKDIYSADGKTLLLERGTKIIGEQTSALLQGQARVFVLWNEAETPHGIKVNLASPSAGQLGEAGIGANVDYHFFHRFSGAVMISLLGDLSNYYSNRNKNSNNPQISFEGSATTAQDMAVEVLRNTINIPPTGYIHQGTIINIMVARDVDFSSVYKRIDH